MTRGMMTLMMSVIVALGCRATEDTTETTQTIGVDTPVSKEGTVTETLASEPPAPERTIVVAAPGQPDPRVLYRVPLQGNEPQRGPDDALITIVEFSDFECPFSKNMQPTLEQLLQKYGDDIRVVWMNFPVPGHRNARTAATAALEAQAQKGDEGFWKMHEKLFSNQGALDRDDLERYAKEIRLNMSNFRKALDTDKYADVIDRQVALATSLGVTGTPTYYMNGRHMAGFPFQTWAFAIDRRLAGVQRAVDEGVPRSALYERIIADGKTEP
jgi:protein-disulfide isomerase